MATILYVDDEPSVGSLLEQSIEQAGHQPIGAHTVPDALHILARGGVDLIIADYQLPGFTGLDFLDILKRDGVSTPVIMLTGYASIEHAVMALKAGAIDYLTKPVNRQALVLAIEQALALVGLRRENQRLRTEVATLRQHHAIIGDSPALQRARADIAMAAPTRANVLLLGESGTGKSLLARALHDQSERHTGPFVQLHCEAIPADLLEHALFGHETAPRTGPIQRTEGAFERAHRGTLLLHEVSAIPLDLQAKLLRVLHEQAVTRVGGTTTLNVDTRIIATSRRDLVAESAAGRFRQDLFLQLGVVPVHIPPLRDRPEDIPLLAMHFAMHAAEQYRKDTKGLSPDAIAWLRAQPWPGNVRELQHLVERTVILAQEPMLQVRNFAPSGPTLPTSPTPPTDPDAEGDVLLRSLRIADAENALIRAALARTGGNRTKAAELLGISVRTLRNRLNTPDAPPL